MDSTAESSSHLTTRRIKPVVLAAFAMLAGLLATLWGYVYAGGNEIEQLPIILRAIDPAYLVRDFFTNTSAEFGPRFYYAHFIALIATEATLPAVFFFLTALANSGIAWVSARFALHLFDDRPLAGVFAAAAVLSLKTFWLGSSNVIYRSFLEPGHLIAPLLLASVWLAYRRQPIGVALCCGLASMVHPLLGLETGAILLAVMAISAWYARRKSSLSTPVIPSGSAYLRALLIFAAFAAANLLPYSHTFRLSTGQFVSILAQFRHPHHYLPSTFGAWQYLQAGVFLFAGGAAFSLSGGKAAGVKKTTLETLALAIIITLLCLIGYVFVELVPVRLAVSAQLFRLLYLLKWLGLVFLAGRLGMELETRQAGGERAGLLFQLAGLVTPATAAVGQLFALVFPPERSKRKWTFWLSLSLAALAAGLVAWLYRPGFRALLLFPLLAGAGAILVLFPGRIRAYALSASLMTALGFCLLWGSRFLPAYAQTVLEYPSFTLAGVSGQAVEVARYARDHTPEDALFLTPPKFGDFRLLAKRAIVVDFISFPFQDDAMLEWKERMFTCYTEPVARGFDAIVEMSNQYKRINDQRLLALKSRYGFEYAVLYRATQTAFPVLYESPHFKIVSVP